MPVRRGKNSKAATPGQHTQRNMKTPLLPLAASLLLSGMALCGCKQKAATDSGGEAGGQVATATDVAFCADSAMAFVTEQCAFGPRVPNSEAHTRCGDYIAAKFRSYGLTVTEQKAVLTGWDGVKLNNRNIIAAYQPENKTRVVLCAHWDSRPWADADPDSAKHREPVMAANDGASGVAVLIEVARLLSQLKPAVGVDLICFDSEDYGRPYWAEDGSGDGEDWCLGSTYWSKTPHESGYTARFGILLDMVGGLDARFHYEGFSLEYAQAIVGKVWSAAQIAGSGHYFPQADGGYVTDDHVPMNRHAGIPTIDIIPFGNDLSHSFSSTWHTTHDTPENIDPETMRAVGQTLLQVLAEEQP